MFRKMSCLKTAEPSCSPLDDLDGHAPLWFAPINDILIFDQDLDFHLDLGHDFGHLSCVRIRISDRNLTAGATEGGIALAECK